jgi:6,7-dimethyl-8-ribityllumazine synthase
MTDRDRPGTYNPFEDTGDWPFRESAPPPVQPPEQPAEQDAPFDLEQHEREEHDADLEPAAPLRLEELSPERVEEPEPEPEAVATPEPEPEPVVVPAAFEPDPAAPEPQLESAEPLPAAPEPLPVEPVPAGPELAAPPEEHAAGELEIPEGPEVLEGGPNGFRRTVAVVVSRFNADVTNRLLESALDALTDAHVTRESITVVPVPGAFELPLAAMALAKTRRFSCVVALGCVIRGETPHFDYVAGEAASGLQLAAIETGVPVSFGLLTCETKAQAEARVGRGADAARAALEMADLFTQVRTRAARSG